MSEQIPTYWSYLDLDKLLTSQGGLTDNESDLLPDELHFIIVHQTLELWLKLMLSELRLARDHLGAHEVPEQQVPSVVHHMRRVIEIFKLAVSHFDVVETLTARDFLAFRDKLFPASGFQSYQMREMEIVLGLDESKRAKLGNITALQYLKDLAPRSAGGTTAWAKVEAATAEMTLRTAEAGVRARYEASIAHVTAFLRATDLPEENQEMMRRVRAAVVFVESYRELPLLAWPRLLLDTAVELEQRLLLFRQRHARMAERIIGRRVGTGGSAGVEYLDKTSDSRIFTNLWEVRTVLLSKDALPPMVNAEAYDFVR
jgi:tryptophan 2,3-dioxygenase